MIVTAHASLDDASLDKLAKAVVDLDPKPRQRRWVSLAFCLVDAVWSIGAHYDNVVVPLVREGVARRLGVDQPTAPADGFQPNDPLSLRQLADLGLDELTELTNLQRTSTRGGILKAEAVLWHCRLFRESGVETLEQAIELMGVEERFSELDRALRSIPGEGSYGIRRGYLWMMIGNDNLIKPDRMVLRWLARQGVRPDPAPPKRLRNRSCDLGCRPAEAELIPGGLVDIVGGALIPVLRMPRWNLWQESTRGDARRVGTSQGVVAEGREGRCGLIGLQGRPGTRRHGLRHAGAGPTRR